MNGKIYIGQDIHNNPNYLGSGRYFKRALEKYGKENFKKEILCECSSLKELNEAEIFWIKELDAQNPEIGYNIANGGRSGFTGYHSEETKKKMSILAKNRIRKPHSEETKKKIAKGNTGKIVSEETRKRISEKSKGRKGMWTISEEHKRRISEVHTGKKLSDETKEKIRISLFNYRNKKLNTNGKINE